MIQNAKFSSDKIAGVRVSDIIEEFPVSKVKGVSKVNLYVTGRKADSVLIDDIRENGLQEPLVLDANLEIVRGRRRFAAIERLGHKTVKVRILETGVDEEKLAEVCYSDFLRENLTEEQQVEVIEKHFGKKAIMAPPKSPEAREILKNVVRVLRVKNDRARELLAITRRKIFREEMDKNPERERFTFPEESFNYAKIRIERLEKVAEKIANRKAALAEDEEEKRLIEKELLDIIPRGSGIRGGKENRLEAIRRAVKRRL